MPLPALPPDRAARELEAIYGAASRHLQALIAQGLATGRAPGTRAYREAQLRAVQAVVATLRAQGPQLALNAAHFAYGSSTAAVDRVTIGNGRALAGRFSGVHQRAVEAIAGNMAGALDRAAEHVGRSAATVFELADLIDGSLGPDTGVFLGRRVDDRARAAALQTVAEHLATASTRRDASAALRARIARLATSQSTDALQLVRDELTNEAKAAFIDRAGRRWDLDVYTRMVARTTTREAVTRGTANRLLEHDLPLVQVSKHNTLTPLCQEFEGRVYSLRAEGAGRHPVLSRYPPFHPNCRHYLTPAGTAFEDFERALSQGPDDTPPAAPPAAPAPGPDLSKLTPRQAEAWRTFEALPEGERSAQKVADAMGVTVGRARVYISQARHVVEGTTARRPGAAAQLLTPPRPPAPPFGSRDTIVRTGPDTAERLEDQRIAYLVAGDPGPEPGQHDGWLDAVVLEDRATTRAFNRTLGPDLVRELDRAWAKNGNIRQRLQAGELTVSDVEDMAIEEWNTRHNRQLMREAKRQELRTKAIPCFHCGRLKPRPADICDYCGDDPVTVDVGQPNRAAMEAAFNRGYGYSS